MFSLVKFTWPVDKWIKGNFKQVGFYRVHYDNDNWNALIKQLNTDHTVGSGILSFSVVIQLLLTSLFVLFGLSFIRKQNNSKDKLLLTIKCKLDILRFSNLWPSYSCSQLKRDSFFNHKSSWMR